MFKDILEIIKEVCHKIAGSRLFALSVVFSCMFIVLVFKLFHLQIIEGEQYLNDYIQRTEKTVTIAGTRGNIYDRNGNILAYNELAYSVSIQDTGAYNKNADRNHMLYKLVSILNSHGKNVEGKFEVGINSEGQYIYTSSSEAARKRFLRDYYGLKNVDQLDDASGKYPSDAAAKDLVQQKTTLYELDKLKDEKGNPIILSSNEILQIINIRYTMSFTAYQKYETTTIASYVDEETVADIMENTASMEGVSIEESTVRVYNDSTYFAHIIGYTGKIQEDQLEELQKSNPDYNSNDVVGRIGIEQTYELDLQGSKGSRTMYVDNMGRVMEITAETQAQSGHDIYLTIDRDLQIGIYNLIERQLAGILKSQLVNKDVTSADYTDSSNMLIPVKDAYFQLINNNILSLEHFSSDEAQEIEKKIYEKFSSSREQILNEIRQELTSEQPTKTADLSEAMKTYMQYIYSYLSSDESGIVMKDKIDVNSEEYISWTREEIGLRDFLYSGIANNWINTTGLDIENKYSDADDIFNQITEYVISHLREDPAFSKKIYRFLINDNVVSGRELCLALYAQGVLSYDENEVRMLEANGADYAFTFLVDKISKIEITPAQLALDPCTGSCVITDVNTGEVLALVSYPSYDNNRLSGTMDAAYYNTLLNDLSLPLYNNATQARRAPGSTFKPITAVAGLEEKAISLTDVITCTGEYDEITPAMKCWIYPGAHGALNVIGGIENSCNYFFGEVAHRLSMDASGNYVPDLGIEQIRKYASMFGLDHKSGIEINENDPYISDENPERSAIGQGTHAYSNIQLSRYTAALASKGNVYELSLIDKVTDSDGNLINDQVSEISSHIDIADSTWNAVHTGMRRVISNGSGKNIFRDLEVDIAGKTGTAQESKTRANHAYFISFAPYDNPEICVTVNIPYGYSSSNAATVAKNVYRFYYGYLSLDYILSNGALDVSDVKIGD